MTHVRSEFLHGEAISDRVSMERRLISRTRTLVVATILAFGIGICGRGAALASPLDDANAAYERKDYAAAVEIYRRLAEQGDVKVQNRLGSMYSSGRGVTKDAKEAIRWYRRAAEQGSGNAQWNLGLDYEGGLGVSQDYMHAYMWDSLAADQGIAIAAMSRDDVAAKMTSVEIAQAQTMAAKCKAQRYKNCN